VKRLVWRVSALDDLAAIIGYITDRNLPAAERLEAAIDAIAQTLTAHPLAFRPGRVAGTREAVVHPNYILIYRVTVETVEIVSVVHARQRYP
jgi:toxin ParE1/3/4